MDCTEAIFGAFQWRGRQMDKYDRGMRRWMWGGGLLHTNKQEAKNVSWQVKVLFFALSSADPSQSQVCINQGLI